MIKETVNEYRFADVLLADEYASWSHGATKALFEYYEQLSEDLGKDIELDRVAIRCEWNEWDDALEVARLYGFTVKGKEATDESDIEAAREWLEERTTVLDVENTEYVYTEKTTTEKTVNSILVMEF